jgi:hypothetical protein
VNGDDRDAMIALLRCSEALAAAQEAHVFHRKYGAYHRAYLEVRGTAARLRKRLSQLPGSAQNSPQVERKGGRP